MLVPVIQALVPGPGRNDCRARPVDLPHENPSLGSAVCSGVRQTLEPLRNAAGTSWRADETYVRIRGRWACLYRAVDASGKTVDFRLSPPRNVALAKAFFRKAVRLQPRSPENITLDGYAASHRAVRELQEQGRLPNLTKLRSSKYLNNLIEQGHRNVKSRLGTMLGHEELRFRCHYYPWRRAHASHPQRTV